MTQRVTCSDGVTLFATAEGPEDVPALLFAHEFGGDWRTWDDQVAAFKHRFRCIRFCARGFLPSQVPGDLALYGQSRAIDDLLAVADHFELGRFHLVGCSMGSFTALQCALGRSERVLSLTLVGCSSGPEDGAERESYRQDLRREIDLLESKQGAGAVQWFADDPAYQRMASKRPASWRSYLARLENQSVTGALLTLRSVHWNRLSLFEQKDLIAACPVPTLLVFGDEDHPLIRPTADFLSATLPQARPVSFPKTGHLVHLEHAGEFNELLAGHLEVSA